MARVALDADVVVAFLDPGDDQHVRAVGLLRAHLAAGDDLLVGATVYAETIVRPLQLGLRASSTGIEQSWRRFTAALDRPPREIPDYRFGAPTNRRGKRAVGSAALRLFRRCGSDNDDHA